MISEATGEMRKVEGTVYLDGNLCMCAWSVGGCPRQEYCYWREVWLKRVDPGAKVKIEPGLWNQMVSEDNSAPTRWQKFPGGIERRKGRYL